MKILTSLAKAGHAVSQHNLGVFYEDGRAGLAKDRVKAIKWARKAAKQGMAQSEYSLASMLKKNGDNAEALEWMTKAADRGYPNAHYSLGNWYFEGKGVPQDLVKAKNVSEHKRCLSSVIRHPSPIIHSPTFN